MIKEDEIISIIKEELKKYIIFKPHNEDIAYKIYNKIKAYVKELEYLHRGNKIKRILTYRILSIISEFIVVTLITGKWEYGVITTPLCLILHTLLHGLVEKIFI